MCYKAAKVITRDGTETEAQKGCPSRLLGDEELAARAQLGDQVAAGELVARYQQKAYAVAYHMCSGDSQEAQDLTQEAFLRAFRGIGKFRGDSTFYTWFYRIVVNVCLDGRRRGRRWERIFSPSSPEQRGEKPSKTVYEEQADKGTSADPMTVLTGKQLSQEIRKALNFLPEKQRMAFQLKVLHDMSIREIAQIMGTAEGTVKSHLFRATRFLRDELKEWA